MGFTQNTIQKSKDWQGSFKDLNRSLSPTDSGVFADPLISQALKSLPSPILRFLMAVFLGVALLAALAQIAIPLPWSPVPVTGQTFGVALVALLWGQKRGLAVFASYLSLAGLGLPVLASGLSGWILGPTFGYLIGMLFATYLIGGLRDAGYAKGFWSSLACVYSGSFLIFSFGLIGLSFFVPKDQLLVAGLWPFLLGDLIKNSLAASIYSALCSSEDARLPD